MTLLSVQTTQTMTTRIERQFWRESEQAWVDHVLIRTWGAHKDEPKRWRSRKVTSTTTYGEWRDTKS